MCMYLTSDAVYSATTLSAIFLPVRPHSCIVRGLSGSGWCVRSCESPDWWSWVLLQPETLSRYLAPSVTLPVAASSSGPALPTRTYIHTNQITSDDALTQRVSDIWHLWSELSDYFIKTMMIQCVLKTTKTTETFALLHSFEKHTILGFYNIINEWLRGTFTNRYKL